MWWNSLTYSEEWDGHETTVTLGLFDFQSLKSFHLLVQLLCLWGIWRDSARDLRVIWDEWMDGREVEKITLIEQQNKLLIKHYTENTKKHKPRRVSGNRLDNNLNLSLLQVREINLSTREWKRQCFVDASMEFWDVLLPQTYRSFPKKERWTRDRNSAKTKYMSQSCLHLLAAVHRFALVCTVC